MRKHFYILCLAITVLASGCSNDPIHRLAYGAIQGVGREQCMNNTTTSKWNDCLKNESYDDYQRKRQELNSAN